MRRLAPSPSLGCWSYRPADLPWGSMYYVKRYMFIQICSGIPSALSVAWLLGALHMRYENLRFSLETNFDLLILVLMYMSCQSEHAQ